MSSLAPYTNAMRSGQGSVLHNSALTIKANNAHNAPGSTHTRKKYVLKTQSSSSLLDRAAQILQEGDVLLETQSRYGVYQPLQQCHPMTEIQDTRAATSRCDRMPLRRMPENTMRICKDRIAHILRSQCRTSSLDRIHLTSHRHQFSRRN